MTQALYRKWRPQTWDEVVGQDHIVQTLRNAVRAGRVAHAYLFAGPRGTGKTTTARLLAKAVNCLSPEPAERPCNRCANCAAVNEGRFLDLIEIDAASNTSVEDVRDLRDKIHFAPNVGAYKVYIVDEVHMLSTAAFNALLKTLEEPPAHAIFVLATTEVHKIPATVLSRCQRHEFRRLPVSDIIQHLQDHLAEEGLQAEPGVLELIARQATGSLRDAISMVDQLGSAGDKIGLAMAHAVLGTAAGEAVRGIVGALIRGDLAEGLSVINRALDGGADPRQLSRQVVDYLRGLLLVRLGDVQLVEATPEDRAEMVRQAASMESGRILSAIRSFNRAAVESRAGWQPGLPIEMALVEAVQAAEAEASAGPLSSQPAAAPTKSAERGRGAGMGGSSSAGAGDHPPSTAATSSASPTVPPGVGVTFQRVLEHWRDILAAARRRDPRTQALLNSCRPMGIEAGVLILGFASDILREKMDKGHSLSLAQEALAEVLGERIGIRSALTSASVEAGEGASAILKDEGMVATALRDLGGQIVDVRPVPPEEGSV